MTTPRGTLDGLYSSIEREDWDAVSGALHDDVFVFTPVAEGVLTSADDVAADLRRWTEGTVVRIEREEAVSGTSASGTATWIFDRLTIGPVPLRVTALLTRDPVWRIAAAYWSVPFETQDEQDLEKREGRLEPGIELQGSVPDDARPVAEALQRAVENVHELPTIYSERADHVTIGSVTDEVFIGAAGRAAWTEFVEHVKDVEFRGPLRAKRVGEDACWLAANLDISVPPTPYRFFYVWILDDGEWRVVLSHDAVSRDPRYSKTP